MKLHKYEIANAIDKVKSIVPKEAAIKALEGVLVNNGYLIASNMEVTVTFKLEGSEGERPLIIPAKAFDLIKNLPEGDVTIVPDENNVVTIKMEKIKNKYQSVDPFTFPYDLIRHEGMQRIANVDGKKIMEIVGHVIYAAAKKGADQRMTGIYFNGHSDRLEVAALDGHKAAVDAFDYSYAAGLKAIVPNTAARKLISMGIIDNIDIYIGSNGIAFETGKYTIHSRIIEGEYYNYGAMFGEGPIKIKLDRMELIEAMARAVTCVEDKPVVFEMNGKEMKASTSGSLSEYSEVLTLHEELLEPVKIGFNPVYLLETLKAFDCSEITVYFKNAKAPAVVENETGSMKALVLPVMIRG